MKASKFITIALLVCIFYFLGYVRNYIFVTINAQAAATYYHTTPPPLNSFMSFIDSRSYNWLFNFKWFLTLLFAIIYCSLSALSIFILFKKKSYTTLCIILYLVMLIVSAIFMGLGYLFHNFSHSAFDLARNIMHLGQSPLITLLIVAGLYFYRKRESTT